MKDLHQDWRGRKQAIAEMAGERGQQRAVTADQLVDLIREETLDLGVLNGAMQTLIALGPSALPRLQPLLASRNSEVRQAGAVILGQLEPPLGAPILLGLLEDEDVNVRYHAIEALGQQQALAASPRLCALARGSDPFLAFAAVEALGRIGDPAAAPDLRELLDDPVLGESAAEALGVPADEPVQEESSPEPEWLARQLDSVDARTRLLYIQRGLQGAPPLVILRELLGHPSESVRAAATRWLSAVGEPPEGWQDFSPRMRCEVVEEVRSLPVLLEYLGHDAEGLVVLRRLTEWPSQPELVFPERDDLWWNVYLCRLLGVWKLRPHWLEERLNDLRAPVRAEAAKGLALADRQRALARLPSLLLDSELDVAESALQALASIGCWQPVREALDEPRLRDFARGVLAGSPHQEDLEILPADLLLGSDNPAAYQAALQRVEELSRVQCGRFREIVRKGWRPAALPDHGRRWLPLIFQDVPELIEELAQDSDEWVRRGAQVLSS